MYEISCRGNQTTYFIVNNFFLNRVICEITQKKYGTARQATDENVTRGMRIAYWITKATDTQLKYVLPITFLLQHLLHERTSNLSYTSNACIVLYKITMWYLPSLISCVIMW